MSRPPGEWRPAPECKPLWLHRTRCCWCHRQSPNRPTAFYVMADGDSPFAQVASLDFDFLSWRKLDQRGVGGGANIVEIVQTGWVPKN